jgi:RNA polymerase sigma factor (sigma-70 family)
MFTEQQIKGHLYPLAHRLAKSATVAGHTREDLAQECMLRVVEQADKYEPRPGVDYTHWAARVMRRHLVSLHRESVQQRRTPQGRFAPGPLIVDPADETDETETDSGLIDTGDPLATLIAEEEHELFEQAIKNLVGHLSCA